MMNCLGYFMIKMNFIVNKKDFIVIKYRYYYFIKMFIKIEIIVVEIINNFNYLIIDFNSVWKIDFNLFDSF